MPRTKRKRKAAPPEPQRRAPSLLEFRAPVDDAWYDAHVTVQCGALRVMYEGFLEELDEWYDPAALATAGASARDVAALRARFRVWSMPLEDTQCRGLQAGALLCVSCALDGGDLKFYDAVLESQTAPQTGREIARSPPDVQRRTGEAYMTATIMLLVITNLRALESDGGGGRTKRRRVDVVVLNQHVIVIAMSYVCITKMWSSVITM
ncbi:uncharacterized protein [Miscanthus floridulus]|uniref:uncharacterized protein n=1 Tax=Miscanthus floridulus TaxID=154761 RepID=UPI00345A32B9